MRDHALETIVIDAVADRLLSPDRLRKLLANLLDDSSAAVRDRQAHLKALRTERTRIEGAIQNMFDFIDQGIVSPRGADFTARLANQRTRRADLEQKFCWSSANSRLLTNRSRPKRSIDWERFS